MAMTATDVVLSDVVPISQDGSENAEVGSAEDARVVCNISPFELGDLLAKPKAPLEEKIRMNKLCGTEAGSAGVSPTS